MKKVLIISSSPREKTAIRKHYARLLQKVLRESGHEVELVSLRDKTINFCRGCFACQKTQKCVINDDAIEICQKALEANVLVFATPIYYYEMSGQLKTMLDRLNPLYPSDYAFTDVYFLSSAAEDEEEVPERAVNGVEGWVECFERAHLAGSVFWAVLLLQVRSLNTLRWKRRAIWEGSAERHQRPLMKRQ